ncbi:hypothetical protein ACTFIU_011232 [Dictyostelium citrinum]
MKIGVSIFILLFLLVQSYFPISFYYRFYFEKDILDSNINNNNNNNKNIDRREPETITFSELNLKQHDERFSWRMFSPTAIDTKLNGNVSSTNNRRDIKRSMQKEQRQKFNSTTTTTTTNFSNNKETLSKRFDFRKKNKSNLLDKFFIDFKFSEIKIQWFKFIFYMMMAIDCWLEIPRLSNFWITPGLLGSFTNASHFPIEFDNFIKNLLSIDSLINEKSFLISLIIGGVLSIRCALSINIKYIEPLLLALLKGYLVLSSQSDNYQHHYLLVLVLFLLSTIDWNNLSNQKPLNNNQTNQNYNNNNYNNNNNSLISCWQLKLLLLQLSVVYFWTSIAKLHWSWINGSVLPRMIGPEFRDQINQLMLPLIENSFIKDRYPWLNPMMIVSCSTIVVELFLVFSLHIKKLSLLSFILGISMHTIMGTSGLRIGTFSYFMCIFYILLLPNSWFNIGSSSSSSKIIKNQYQHQQNENNNFKKIILKTITIGIIGGVISKFIFKLFSTHWWFIEYFEISFLFIVLLMIIQSLTNRYNSIKKQLSIFLSICLLVALCTKVRIEFRSAFIERGTMSIRINNIDEAINNYQISKELAEQEWKLPSTLFFNNQSSSTSSSSLASLSNWLTGGTSDEKNYEFIGDLGLFLESKNKQSQALEIYEKYYQSYPNILKIHAGFIRCLSSNPTENKLKLCKLLPETFSLANKTSKLICENQDCSRSKGHANYVLDLIKKTKKNINCQ